MPKFFVSVNRGSPFELEASDSFEAWDTAFKLNPWAERVDVVPEASACKTLYAKVMGDQLYVAKSCSN